MHFNFSTTGGCGKARTHKSCMCNAFWLLTNSLPSLSPLYLSLSLSISSAIGQLGMSIQMQDMPRSLIMQTANGEIPSTEKENFSMTNYINDIVQLIYFQFSEIMSAIKIQLHAALTDCPVAPVLLPPPPCIGHAPWRGSTNVA